MTGACIIDGTDLATLGIFILKGGDHDLLAFPEQKEPLHNDWFEQDGLEVDWGTLTFKPRKVKVKYYLSAPDSSTFKSRLNAFENMHYAAGNRQMYVREFNHTFSLQFIGVSDYQHQGGYYKTGQKSAHITVEYADNDPLAMFSPAITLPLGGGIATRVLFNGTDFADYGLIIQEVYSTALRIRKPKKGLVQTFAHLSGAVADLGFIPQKESREIEIKCTLLADTLDAFWTNYTALFNQMAKQEALTITLVGGEQINCYYQAMANVKKLRPFKSRVMMSFSLKFNEV